MSTSARWITRSIRRKAILGLLVILLSTVFFISITMASQARKFIFNEVKRRAATVARFVSSEVVRYWPAGDDNGGSSELLTRLCDDPDILYVTIIGADGDILATGCSAQVKGPGYSLPLGDLYDLTGDQFRYHSLGDVLEVYHAVEPLSRQGRFLVMGFDVSEVDLIVSRITSLIAGSALVVYVLGLLALVVGVNRITAPLERLTEGMKDIGAGKLPEKVPVKTFDELGQLAAAFNIMIDDLASYRDQVERYRRHLEDMVQQRTDELNQANVDLTRTNRELSSANEKLLELDRLKSNFLGIATHELKTPITVIEGYLDSLIDGFAGDLSAVQTGIVDQALISCRRMADLVSDMLDVTRIESGKLPIELEETTMAAIIKRVSDQMAPLLAAKEMRLAVEPQDQDAPIRVDGERIFQVLVNLIGNAIKFAPADSAITVTSRMVEGDSVLETTVADEGIGISAEELPVVFDEFAQVGPPGKEEGTGLGLAICKGIVEAHGGSIWAESEVGKGSSFIFRLPV